MSPPVFGSLSLDGETQILARGSLDIADERERLVCRMVPGAYDLDGALDVGTIRTPFEMTQRHNATLRSPCLDDVVEAYDETVVWGGNIVDRYGNFLTETVSRLWPTLPKGSLEGRPIVFTAPHTPTFAGEWLASFGANMVELPKQGAIRFRRTLAPEPAWKIGDWIAPELRDIHLHARRGLDVPPAKPHDTIWLSRSGQPRGRAPYDEALLEWILRDHVTPVCPETMTLGEQVGMLESSRAVAGVVGSAFHTLLLTVDTPDCLYLSAPMDRSIYTGPQRLMNIAATFALALGGTMHMRSTRERGRLFPGSHRILIPEALRAFGSSVLPALREDRRLATFAEADRPPGAPSLRATPADELDAAAMRVVRNPLAFDQRMALAEMFEERNLTKCAAEQYIMVAELSEDLEEPARRAARRMDRAGESPP